MDSIHAAVVHAVISAAYYRTLPQIVVGPLLHEEQRQKLFKKAGLEQCRAELDGIVSADDKAFRAQVLDMCWRVMAGDWNVETFFEVQGTIAAFNRVRSVSGSRRRLGRPISVTVFLAFQTKVRDEVFKMGYSPTYELHQSSCLEFKIRSTMSRQGKLQTESPSHMDDGAIPIVTSGANLLLVVVARTAEASSVTSSIAL